VIEQGEEPRDPSYEATWCVDRRERAARGRRRRSGRHEGAVAEAGGMRAPSQNQATRGRRHRSERHVGASAGAGGTRAPLTKRAARGRHRKSGRTWAPSQKRVASGTWAPLHKRAARGRRRRSGRHKGAAVEAGSKLCEPTSKRVVLSEESSKVTAGV